MKEYFNIFIFKLFLSNYTFYLLQYIKSIITYIIYYNTLCFYKKKSYFIQYQIVSLLHLYLIGFEI